MDVLNIVVAALHFLLRCLDNVLFPPHCLITNAVITDIQPLPLVSKEGLDGCCAAPEPIELLLTAQRHFAADDLACSSITAMWSLEPRSPAQSLIVAIKYRGHQRLAIEMGRMLGLYLQDSMDDGSVLHKASAVTFVAVHHTRLRERGYNQAELIAGGVAEVLNKPLLNTLVRCKNTGTQTMLGEAERATNMNDAFVVEQPDVVIGKHLLLVDDVFTTGATVNAAATALISAGARRVDVVTLCATL